MQKKYRVKMYLTTMFLCLFVLMAGLPAISQAAPPKGEPFIFGFVGNVSSPGTKPSMDIQKVAVEEVNAGGGILGRPVVLKILDGKGDTSLSVEAARKLIIEDKALFVCVEGRSEIGLAVQETSGMLVKEYPHILVFQGAMASELTGRILDQAPKYDHCFRDFDSEPSHYSYMKYWLTQWKTHLKVKKIAFLWEDLAWTAEWRNGVKYLNLPSWEEMARQAGMEVVYSKLVKPRGTMYFPILQQLAQKKPDFILYVSSAYTDTETFAKQWADSAAKNIPVSLYGGVAQTIDFWKMTGGKALGIITGFTDIDSIPMTPQTIPFVKKARERGITRQFAAHLAYADIYHFKAALEMTKGSKDLKGLIKAMEEVTTPYSLGKMKYETQKVKPFYHSLVKVDPKSPYKTYPGYYFQPIVQYQKDGKLVWLWESNEENAKLLKKYLDPSQYKTPAELRK